MQANDVIDSVNKNFRINYEMFNHYNNKLMLLDSNLIINFDFVTKTYKDTIQCPIVPTSFLISPVTQNILIWNASGDIIMLIRDSSLKKIYPEEHHDISDLIITQTNGDISIIKPDDDSEPEEIAIYNVLGTQVYKKEINTTNHSNLIETNFNINGKGIFFVVLTTRTRNYTGKFIIN